MCNQTYNYATNVIVFSRSMYVYTYVYRLQKIIKLDHSSTRSHLVQYVSNQWHGKRKSKPKFISETSRVY